MLPLGVLLPAFGGDLPVGEPTGNQRRAKPASHKTPAWSRVSKKQLTNVETIRSDCKTGLPDSNIGVVLLYDTFHSFGDPNGVLEELHRVLKPNGILFFSDCRKKEDEIVLKLTNRLRQIFLSLS